MEILYFYRGDISLLSGKYISDKLEITYDAGPILCPERS